jgi:hypothetical protein
LIEKLNPNWLELNTNSKYEIPKPDWTASYQVFKSNSFFY